jgi:hypothetical protein
MVANDDCFRRMASSNKKNPPSFAAPSSSSPSSGGTAAAAAAAAALLLSLGAPSSFIGWLVERKTDCSHQPCHKGRRHGWIAPAPIVQQHSNRPDPTRPDTIRYDPIRWVMQIRPRFRSGDLLCPPSNEGETVTHPARRFATCWGKNLPCANSPFLFLRECRLTVECGVPRI